ncbi:sugar ABC transporter substrate-binding protein [Microbacterium sp. MPKO10]|uniref:sugar ABC transporter substrate-binding protein n=1 Tax=Microbacterium sp. MPKO10 TaxID=2989818 RepID=UPI0022355B84|nr:sugar ABC transporter substrate-binding protein [Microbacterium sp. MPKO10]MCW4457489.1 sugar ABC transporter substrate-binding protein [Microbacterium sp. MPKO10]
MKHTTRILAGIGVLALGSSLAACSADAGGDDSYSIVFLAASSQNGYNQAVYSGIKERAQKLSGELGIEIETKLQDGQFDANTQLSQLQNAGTTGQADGIIVVPHDGPSLGAAFPLGQDIPVATVLNPIGPDISEMEPQVEGVVSTVASPPAKGAKLQAESAVKYCEDIDPCKIGLLAGLLSSPLDIERVDAWKSVLGEHDNIQIVGTVEGGYDRDQSLKAVTNLLQGDKDINGIISSADQQTMGAQIALENAGIDPSSIFLTGSGGTTGAIEAVLAGTWTNDYINVPASMGEEALQQIINSLRDEEVQSVVDADELVGFGPIATKEDLEAHPEFTGEWNG